MYIEPHNFISCLQIQHIMLYKPTTCKSSKYIIIYFLNLNTFALWIILTTSFYYYSLVLMSICWYNYIKCIAINIICRLAPKITALSVYILLCAEIKLQIGHIYYYQIPLSYKYKNNHNCVTCFQAMSEEFAQIFKSHFCNLISENGTAYQSSVCLFFFF